MAEYTDDFSLNVRGVKGLCPAGEEYVEQQIAAKTTPVLSCEGPCIKGEIARLAANLITRDDPSLARACHGEAFYVPHSGMAAWVKGADQILMIDGCFLRCHGRVLDDLVGEAKVVHVDAYHLHGKYGDLFLAEDVPEEERRATARHVADRISAGLKEAGDVAGEPGKSQACAG